MTDLGLKSLVEFISDGVGVEMPCFCGDERIVEILKIY